MENSFRVSQHVVVPEPQYSITSLIQKLSPPLISLNLISMMSSIQLDDQLRFRAKEVNDEAPDGLLAAKLAAVHLSVTQTQPQFPFGVGLVATEALGVRAKHSGI